MEEEATEAPVLDGTEEDKKEQCVNEEDNGGDAENDEEDEDDDEEGDDVHVTIDEDFRAVQKQPQQAKPAAVDLDAGQAILNVDLNNLEDKPWRKPGAQLSDYFNYGFDETTWKIYCDKQKKMKQIADDLAQETFQIPVVSALSDMGGRHQIPTIGPTVPPVMTPVVPFVHHSMQPPMKMDEMSRNPQRGSSRRDQMERDRRPPSPRDSRSHRSRRSRSRDRDKGNSTSSSRRQSARRDDDIRESKKRRSRSRSEERISRSKRHKSSRR